MDSPARNDKGHLLPGRSLNPTGRPRGARGIAAQIMAMTNNGQDMTDWCLLLWKDVDAPIEWRWKAFEWLSNRALGPVSTNVINVVGNINSGRDLRSLSDDDLEKIDGVFREAHGRKMIDTTSVEVEE